MENTFFQNVLEFIEFVLRLIWTLIPIILPLLIMALGIRWFVRLRYSRDDDPISDRLAAISSNADGRYYIVSLFYATDRKPTGDKRPSQYYGAERGNLVYGQCDVTIPRRHHLCVIERPHWWMLRFKENTSKDIILLGTTQLEWDELVSLVKKDLNIAPRRKILIFVHGYNVSFAEAARRTAQLVFDLSYEGVPFLFSWPSAGSTLGYIHDLECARGSASKFRKFILDIATQSNCGDIQIIAHSMGGVVITEALRDAELRSKLDESNVKLSDIILAAPDLDAKVFAEEIVPAIASVSRSITVYASSGDMPLTMSSYLRGGMQRVGIIDTNREIVDMIDTIDASNIADSLLGHGYFSDTAPMINDMYHLLRHGLPPSERNLQPVECIGARYWIFPPR
ncbi:MAG: alpha/beta fold hydrolase [Bacteroidota bacterium]